MAGSHLKFNISPDEFVDHLTEAAYRVALRNGLKAPFVDVEMGIRGAIRRVISRDIRVTAICGLMPHCTVARRIRPFTKEADDLFQKGKIKNDSEEFHLLFS